MSDKLVVAVIGILPLYWDMIKEKSSNIHSSCMQGLIFDLLFYMEFLIGSIGKQHLATETHFPTGLRHTCRPPIPSVGWFSAHR